MSRKTEAKGFKGGFIPPELKTNESRSQKELTQNWQGSIDCEESLLDSRWHKQPPTKGKKGKSELTKFPQQELHKTSSTTSVLDAREVLSAKKKTETTTKSNFPKIIFTDTNTSRNTTAKPTQSDITKTTQTQTEPQNTITASQTSDRSNDTAEICVSRLDPNICIQEEQTHNVEPPTMGPFTQLEACHETITVGLVATVEKAINTVESEEDTPLFRQRLQRVAAATKKDRNLRPLINFVKNRDWEAIKASYGQYWHKIRNRLHVREDCLLIDERIDIPTQLTQTVVDSLHLTHPGSAAMLDLSHYVWFPHIHRSIVQMARNANTAQSKVKN